MELQAQQSQLFPCKQLLTVIATAHCRLALGVKSAASHSMILHRNCELLLSKGFI
jgi:hypothetical protein